jgi:hypothetical protein
MRNQALYQDRLPGLAGKHWIEFLESLLTKYIEVAIVLLVIVLIAIAYLSFCEMRAEKSPRRTRAGFDPRPRRLCDSSYDGVGLEQSSTF